MKLNYKIESDVSSDENDWNKVILMFNGAFPGGLNQWDEIVPILLKNGYKTIRFDYSDGGEESEITFENHARDANNLLLFLLLKNDALGASGCNKVHVLGMAFGSRVALVFATLFPEKIKSLALFDVSLIPPNPSLLVQSFILAAAKRKEMGVDDGKDESYDLSQVLLDCRTSAQSRPIASCMKNTSNLMSYLDSLPIQGSDMFPILFSVGEFDPNSTNAKECSDILKERGHSQVTFVNMPLVGHCSFHQLPIQTTDFYTSFLKQEAKDFKIY